MITFRNYFDKLHDTLNIQTENQRIKKLESFKYLGIYILCP